MDYVASGRTTPSVLYPDLKDPPSEDIPSPACFVDLHLDQIVDAVLAPVKDYALEAFYHSPLRSREGIEYRQAVMMDLASVELVRAIQAFSQRMRSIRTYLKHVEKCHYAYESKRWILGAGQIYCQATTELTQFLVSHDLASLGIRGIRDFLVYYVGSPSFQLLEHDIAATLEGLHHVRYTTLIKDGVTVRRYDDEMDYSAVVTELFAKFSQTASTDYLASFPVQDTLNHVDAMILDRVALLYPDVFARLDRYCAEHAQLMEPIIVRFDRDVQFYLAYRAYIEPLKRLGLEFNYPTVSESPDIAVHNAFDLSLAAARKDRPQTVVCNDIELQGDERILVVTGPNHGGKTTYARMVGQLHYLACLGLPVPGSFAKLLLFDQLLSHFEKSEDIATLRGKLQDDLVRIHDILTAATPRSVIIMNEIFSSTSLEDAVFLSERVMATISDLDAIAVCVTFLVELTVFNEKTVSMVSAIDLEDPSVRTFRVQRKAADGLAYALAVAEKHQVTREWLLKRVAP